jgi:hypothetical protein
MEITSTVCALHGGSDCYKTTGRISNLPDKIEHILRSISLGNFFRRIGELGPVVLVLFGGRCGWWLGGRAGRLRSLGAQDLEAGPL